METHLLNYILIVLGLSAAILFVCSRLRVPTIVGFLLTGVLAGPHGLGLIGAPHEVEILAEVGVVLLLFTIGIEFSAENLLRIKRSALLGGSLQVLFTALATLVIVRHLGQGLMESIFMGFLVSLSSTAIVLRLLQDRAEVGTPHGRTSLAILIYQDIVVIPMMLFTPLLAGGERNLDGVLLLMGKGAGVILLVMAGARWIVPQLLYQIARTRSQELFLLSIIVICFAVAWLTKAIGLSLALGAFLAGLVISESDYAHEALGHILPFRDVFISFFFVSVGMLLDLGFFVHHPGLILLLVLGVMVLKAIIAGGATALLGYPLRTTMLVGLALCQVGEFSFILSRVGTAHGLLPGNIYQIFLAVSVLTMAMTPFIINLSPALADIILKMPLPERLKSGLYPVGIKPADERLHPEDHLIIIGYGVNGRNVARAARVAGIPHLVIEMNPETVRIERAKGEPLFYGDATREAVLNHAGIKRARMAVLVISDPAATRRIAATARKLNPKILIIARTRFVQEVDPLYVSGADEVIPEEFETSVEIFTRVLSKYLIPKDEIERLVAEVRKDGYEMFRTFPKEAIYFPDLKLHLPNIEISAVRAKKGSFLVGKTLAQVELRRTFGVTVLAIRRGEQILSNPGGDTMIDPDDVLVVLAPPAELAEASSLFDSKQRRGGVL